MKQPDAAYERRYKSDRARENAAHSRAMSSQATNAARRRLIEAHRAEYDALYREEALKRGLKVQKP